MHPRARSCRSLLLVVAAFSAALVLGGCSNLVLAVRATQPRVGDAPRLAVTLERQQERGAPLDCLVVPEGCRASVDGVTLKLVDRGGAAKDNARCRPARFELPRGARAAPAAQSKVRVVVPGEQGDEVAEMTVAHLLTPRRPSLQRGTKVRAGDPLVLTWSPASDRVYPAMSGQGLYLYWRPDGFSGHLAAARLQRQGRSYRFTMPKMRPGPVKLRLEPGHPHPRVKVLECSVARCDGGPALPARPVELTVVR